MKPWGRRFGYLIFLLFWVLVISMPTLAVVLAARGQVQVGSDAGRQLRLFHIQEVESEGVGVEWKRPFPQSTSPGQTCSQTNISYLLWKGKGENTHFCQCVDTTTGQTITQTQSCTP